MCFFFFFSSRRRHTRLQGDWSSDVCSSDLTGGGMQGVLGAVLFASVFGLIIAPIFSKLTRFFPPLVNGCVITIIGLSLMPVAAHWAMGGNPQAADYGSMGNIGLAGLSLVIALAPSKLGNALISRSGER